MLSKILSLLAVTSLVAAHFSVDYPYWRGDSFEDPASQWIWPCANVNQTVSAENRTEWPLTGGSIALDVSHQWAITYVNLGLGNNVTSFNVSLVPGFNQTGNGSFCWPEVGGQALANLGLTEGQNATLQVIQLSKSGSALYNCADITFTEDAELLPTDQCQNSTNVGGVALVNADSAEASSSETEATGTETGSAATSTGGAGTLQPPAVIAAAAIAGLGALMLA